MVVDPLAPGVEVVGSTLFGDAAEGAVGDTVFHWDGYVSDLVCLWILVAKLDVAPGTTNRLELVSSKDLDDVPSREIAAHRSGKERRQVVFVLSGHLIRVDTEVLEEGLFILDRLPDLSTMQRHGFVEVLESLLAGFALARHTCLLVDSRPPAIVFFEEPNLPALAHMYTHSEYVGLSVGRYGTMVSVATATQTNSANHIHVSPVT
jgi:hypothetical protein